MKITTIGGLVMSEKKGMEKYPAELKEQAVLMRLKDGLTIRKINKHLGITDEQCLRNSVLHFVKKAL